MIRTLFAAKVFDLPGQNTDYNITTGNARSYQLREVAEANARVRKSGTAGKQSFMATDGVQGLFFPQLNPMRKRFSALHFFRGHPSHTRK